MRTSATSPERIRRFIRRITIALVTGLVIYIASGLIGGGMIGLPLAMTIIIISVITAFVWNTVHRAGIGALPLSIGVALVIVYTTALFGFYGSNTRAVDFDSGGTWVPDKTIGTAISSTVFMPGTFTAALFGFDCNNAYGSNCSETLWFMANGIDLLLIGSGVAVGNILARKSIRMRTD